ncbi:MAG TPA: NADPH-dependent FMN reductase [Tissierellaceae bacterium]|nr:NADPH-dependent FMN reductase [Tissierellaceae bacterium]
MKIVAISGSISKDSYNRKLICYMQERYKDKMEIEILSIEDFPMYNEDIELDTPSIVKEAQDKIKESDGILISTPEFNHSIPGALKNALDWFSRVDHVMIGKPSMIMGASQGNLGTVKAQMHLRTILNSRGIGTLNLPGNEVLIGSIQNKVDNRGNLTDQPTIEFLDETIDNYIEWINKVK